MIKIIKIEKIDSTQKLAKRLTKKINEDFILIAKEQTDAYGRRGRDWYSPRGGLWMTITLKGSKEIDLNMIPIITAISIIKALKKTTKIEAEIKWPNDIQFKDKKIGGIICETEIYGEEIKWIMIGIGININIQTNSFPINLRQKTASIENITNKKHDIEKISKEIIKEFYKNIKNNKKDIIAEWRKKEQTLKRKVFILSKNNKIQARVTDITYDGAIIIEKNKKKMTLYPKDVERIEIIKT